MEIKLDYYDLIEALETYLSDEYGIKRSLSDLVDCPYLDIQQWKVVYKENAEGEKVIDNENCKTVTHCLSLGEGDTITLYLGKMED